MEKPKFRQKKLVQEYKKTLSLSKILFEIGIGTLLGDASLETQDQGKTISHSDFNQLAQIFVLDSNGLPGKKHI